MDVHDVTVTPFTENGTTLYELAVEAGDRSDYSTHATLESAMDSFHPPLSTCSKSYR